MFTKNIAITLLSAIFAAMLSAIIATPVWAKNYEINVNGIVCEFCAFGVAKKLRKLAFIDPANFEDGVKVDIENQRVFISIQEGQALDQEAIFDAIKSGGYEPVKISEIDEVTSPVEVSE